jgi:hypothetical protein
MASIIIAGSRGFTNYSLLREHMAELFGRWGDSGFGRPFVGPHHIISGGARGADALGERFAHEHGLSVSVMKADWDLFGKSAGYRRNQEMAEIADALIAFWDGRSRGTKHMIDIARKRGLSVSVIRTYHTDPNFKSNYSPLIAETF